MNGLIKPLHGLRGTAALSVLVGHAMLPSGIQTRFSASLGVVLFFVLSGFLMGHLYLKLYEAGKVTIGPRGHGRHRTVNLVAKYRAPKRKVSLRDKAGLNASLVAMISLNGATARRLVAMR
ncbi:acyltransferase family protein [Mesorhizobium sp.]|uniref:acyltransferase family protein n=1 Tax=Mesorhizobium sp. TaxID=1871066 RepID=UPI000FE63556|nr:acyltransferase family protein [Mesorhizobium sp.]RWP61688.1 MAG: hypothetical protein EOR08_17320 [Mesorhizobium sp.]